MPGKKKKYNARFPPVSFQEIEKIVNNKPVISQYEYSDSAYHVHS